MGRTPCCLLPTPIQRWPTSDHGYPVLEHVKRLVDDKIIWAPVVPGAVVMTTRGGDFDLHIGQDASIGYLNHTDTVVPLYLQETFTFLLLTAEAAVALALPWVTPPRGFRQHADIASTDTPPLASR